MAGSFHDKITLGRSGLRVSRLGIGASYGVGAADIEWAAERGINFFYWGAVRRPSFGQGVRAVARKDREGTVVVVQTYTRVGLLMRPSVERALRALGIEYADLLLLGFWSAPPPRRIVDAALALKESGKVREIMISCHNRPTFAALIRDPSYGALMVRYNAAHPGAAEEVFPRLDEGGLPRPGVVAFTATRWGTLLDRRAVPAEEPLPRGSDCYRFALSHPDVHTTLCGPKDRAELSEALEALDRGPLSEDELAWMTRVGKGVRTAAKERPRGFIQRLNGWFGGGD